MGVKIDREIRGGAGVEKKKRVGFAEEGAKISKIEAETTLILAQARKANAEAERIEIANHPLKTVDEETK